MADIKTTEDSKATVEEYVRQFNEGSLSGLAEQYVEHNRAYAGGTSTLEDFESKMARLSEVLPDLTLTIEDMVAEGTHVAVNATASATHRGEFYGVEGTGTRLEWAIMMFVRVEDGKIAEMQVLRDILGILQQLDLVTEY